MKTSTKRLICAILGIGPMIGFAIDGRGWIPYVTWSIWIVAYLVLYIIERRKERAEASERDKHE